jgi:glycosyltransferase involved in cell wall biosynthesis
MYSTRPVQKFMPSKDLPFVSVIIIAHNRRDFLEEALRSVSRQTAEPGSFEIILVKNFHDVSIDSLSSKLGVQNVYCEAEWEGNKVLDGIRRSRGEVLTFLDYDDTYSTDRLRAVQEEFAADPDLGFYHNAQEVVDAHGQPTSAGLPLSFRMMNSRRRVRVVEAEKTKIDPRLGLSRPDFNIGSMAVRRLAIDSALPYLERIHIAGDSFLFYAAWSSPYSLVIDPRRLTQYRLHSWNMTTTVARQDTALRTTPSEFISVRVADFTVLLEMVTAFGRKELGQDLRSRLFRDHVAENLGKSTANRRVAWALVRESKQLMNLRNASLLMSQTIGLILLSLASPRFARVFARATG